MILKIIRYSVLLICLCFSALIYAETVWIDVRSAAEHKLDHIEGDVRITHSGITQTIGSVAADKQAEIQLYCRSGGRAGHALAALKAAGYTNVHNAGSIAAARQQRDIVE